ncbi:MAG: CoA pyrophosphatase [Chloroflexi bacterium]|nr:CoA pyrophosphatase [Chloroflexota bacterium]
MVLLTGEDGDLRVMLTRRTERLNGHRGQMSFPGGRRDDSDRDFAHTALRETGEELGIDTAGVALLGALTPIYIPPSHFDVFPYVGYQRVLPPLMPNPDEVAAVYPVALADLFDPENRIVTEIETVAGPLTVPAYTLGGQIVWGATAVILCGAGNAPARGATRHGVTALRVRLRFVKIQQYPLISHKITCISPCDWLAFTDANAANQRRKARCSHVD